MANVGFGQQRGWRGKVGSYVFQKNGSQTIARERVGQVKNPQTAAQMVQRVVFATVTQAADKMLPIIGISQQGVTDPVESRRRWVSQNTKLLREAALRMRSGGAVEAAFAPKGNTQLIPNSYQISHGSLSLAQALVPKTQADNGASFGSGSFDTIGAVAVLVQGQTYSALQLWRLLLGVEPGDQLTFPQIYGEGFAQALFDGNGRYLDCTRFTQFVAPRIVFKTSANASITITSDTTPAQVQQVMREAIDADNTWWDPADIADNIYFTPQTEEGAAYPELTLTEDYHTVFAVNNDDPLRAIGCIRSHKNISSGKWEYSTSYMVCIWQDDDRGSETSDYFGFTLQNAIDTYLNNVTQDSEGNFLQRGTDSNIVPDVAYTPSPAIPTPDIEPNPALPWAGGQPGAYAGTIRLNVPINADDVTDTLNWNLEKNGERFNGELQDNEGYWILVDPRADQNGQIADVRAAETSGGNITALEVTWLSNAVGYTIGDVRM